MLVAAWFTNAAEASVAQRKAGFECHSLQDVKKARYAMEGELSRGHVPKVARLSFDGAIAFGSNPADRSGTRLSRAKPTRQKVPA